MLYLLLTIVTSTGAAALFTWTNRLGFWGNWCSFAAGWLISKVIHNFFNELRPQNMDLTPGSGTMGIVGLVITAVILVLAFRPAAKPQPTRPAQRPNQPPRR